MSSPHTRQLRRPIPKFADLRLATKRIPPTSWYNLRWELHANPANLFFASSSGRFTPASGTAACLYLSPSERTSFLELYGDRLAGDIKAGRTPRLEAADFLQRVYLQVDAPELLLADLTTGDALEKIHLDLGTLYAPDPTYPRDFAEAILQHPTHVDGILYESRHTKEQCAVIWTVRKPRLAGILFILTGNLGLRVNLAGAVANIFGYEIEVAS